MPISSGQTQISNMNIISSSPLREGILSQGQDFVRLAYFIKDKRRILFFFAKDLTILRQYGRQIAPIPECEADVLPDTLAISPPSTIADCCSPSPNSIDSLLPTLNTNKSVVKRSSNALTPVPIKSDDFVFIPEHISIERSLLSGKI